MDDELTDEDLTAIEDRCRAATPGPWFVRHLDDENAMNLTAVGTSPDTARGERWPDFDQGQIIAATLVQHPRYVDSADQRSDANAAFIAGARLDVARLVLEIRRLRAH
jgi:hypothetical protein